MWASNCYADEAVHGLVEGASPSTISVRPIRILIEPSDYVLRNLGDMAMMQVAATRLVALWPDAEIRILSDRPSDLPAYGPNVTPLDSARTPVVASDESHSRIRVSEVAVEDPGFAPRARNASCGSTPHGRCVA